MIPLRVNLKGFLCYKEEQEIDFAGAPVWLLAGLNGSGKSSIFDAVTYALFGHHRGGGHDAVELINKDGDSAQVAFEFSLEGQPFLIQRTLQRAKQGSVRATQLIHRCNIAGVWEAISGTNLLKGFKEWIDQHIGLNYETFTSSVLLLQGRAEKLLDSTAKGRFEVLAGIVDLERYARLHKRADEQRKALENDLKTTQTRVAVLPEVSSLQLIEAQARIDTAEKARARAREDLEQLHEWQRQNQEWTKLQERLQSAQSKLAQARTVLAEAADIENKLQRWRDLQALAPRLKEVVTERTRIVDAERELAKLNKQRDEATAALVRLDEQLRQTSDKRTVLDRKIGEHEQMLTRTNEALNELQGHLTKLNEVEHHEREHDLLLEALKRLISDPAGAVRQAQDKLRQAQEMQQAVGPLGRLFQQREELARAVPGERSAAEQLAVVKTRGEHLRAEVDRLRPIALEAQAARTRSDQESTRTATLLDQARHLRDEFLQIDGAKTCRLCGQALTRSHWKQEKTRRDRELTAAEEHSQQAAEALRIATATEKAARLQLEAAERDLAKAREDYRDQQALARQAAEAVSRCLRECSACYQELPLPFKQRIAETPPSDWLGTTYPGPADVTQARQEAANLPMRERALEDARGQLGQWQHLQGQITLAEQSLQRLRSGLPKDRAGLRQKHASLAADKKILGDDLAALRLEDKQTAENIERLAGDRQKQQERIGKIGAEIAGRESEHHTGQQRLAQLRKELPASWQPLADTAGLADINQLYDERNHLTQEGIEERGQMLQEARLHFDDRRREVADLQSDADKIPSAARQPVAELERLLAAAKAGESGCDQELLESRQHLGSLEEKIDERQRLQAEALKLKEEAMHAGLLAELLGRDRLQLHLVREAERQVVDHANAVLDRLSGGQLFLRLAGTAGGEDSDTKALELEAHNRHTSDKPINIAFLSGSQRFRVAVSLALGIGQYASRQHRPLESVIIDEGFGSLDRFGKQLMIQELHNLRGHMRCILLVSHQEEFAEAFSDGYRFELANGSTVARRFQR
jgi:exonuclease SbcC